MPNEELYMELDLDNINTDEQYCDLETMRNNISSFDSPSGPFDNPNFKIDRPVTRNYPAYFDTETDGPIYNEIPIYFETYMEQPINGQKR